tara:strand:+ start:2620 stop:2883 length:264 start_codon:yes stop_codon:yes gene_type:complete
MNKDIKIILSIAIGLMIILFPTGAHVNGEITKINEKEFNLNKDILEKKKELSVNELLGPEDNFPFLPENHRDSSSPIGRIGKITDVP